MVWALHFQFDSTIDGKAVKIASMIDEHTRESLLHLVERSITAQRLVPRARRCVRPGRRPADCAAHGQWPGVDFPSIAKVLRRQGRAVLHTAGHSMEQRLHDRTSDRQQAWWGSGSSRRGCRATVCRLPGRSRSAWAFHRAESTTSMHHEPFMIHCLAASICPAGKCLISADTKCDVRCSATSPRWESVTTPILFMRL